MKSKHPTKIDKSKTFDKKYYEGKKNSYQEGYNFSPRHKISIPLAKTFLRLGAKRALDVGCATGPLVKALLDVGIDAYGVDVSEWAVQNSPVLNRLSWLDIDADELTFPNEYFDIVISTFVIEHLTNPQKALRDMFRVLKPGGYLYIVTDKLENFTTGQVGHINIRSKKSWLNLLKCIGFNTSKLLYLRFITYYPYEKVSTEIGPIAKKFQIHKMGLVGKAILWIFRSAKYMLERQNSTYLLVLKSQ